MSVFLCASVCVRMCVSKGGGEREKVCVCARARICVRNVISGGKESKGIIYFILRYYKFRWSPALSYFALKGRLLGQDK